MGRKARCDDPETFNSPGLYLWGTQERPLYVGITCKGFGSRFSRYIWATRSQCNLARDFEPFLIATGIDGFPPEILAWYAKSHGSSKARLRGAARFAEEGIRNIWFALLPHDDLVQIEEIERHLVPIADGWNRCRGLRSLLNVEFNRKAQSPKEERQW
jgi:hypothetical protein